MEPVYTTLQPVRLDPDCSDSPPTPGQRGGSNVDSQILYLSQDERIEVTDYNVDSLYGSILSDEDSSQSSRDITHMDVVIRKLQAYTDDSIMNGVHKSQITPLSDDHIRQLLLLYRGSPLTMFIGYLKQAYGECEINMDKVRCDLFDRLKQNSNFPYVNFDLKKRLKTRNCDLPDRLCRDIHSLLGVLDGDDVANCGLKDMISSRQSRASNSELPNRSCTPSKTKNPSGELKFLQETVDKLKAEIIAMKQHYIVVEKERSVEIKALKDTIGSVKSNIHDLEKCMSESVNRIDLCVHRLESDRSTGVVCLKNEMKVLSESIKSVEDNLDTAVRNITSDFDNLTKGNGKYSKTSTNTRKGAKKVKSPDKVSKNSTPVSFSDKTQYSIRENNRNAEIKHPVTLDIGQSPERGMTDSVKGGLCSNVTLAGQNSRSHAETLTTVSDCKNDRPITVRVTDRSTKENTKPSVTHDTCLPSKTLSYKKGSNYIDLCSNDGEDDDDFWLYVKRRPKVYYVGGFKPAITEEKVKSYVGKRGVTVRKLFIIRNQIRETACVKLVVEDNEDADWLENPFFWPKGIYCRLWRSYRNVTDRHVGSDKPNVKPRTRSKTYGRSDLDDYNPYLCLNNDYE